MRLDEAVAYPFLRPAVTFVGARRSVVLVVLLVHRLLVLRAVLTAQRKPPAAGEGAGTLWFVGHLLTSFAAKKKPSKISPRRLVVILFR